MFSLVDVMLVMKVTRNNFILAAKILFKLARDDLNDHQVKKFSFWVFQNAWSYSIHLQFEKRKTLELFLLSLSRSCPTSDSEAFVYGYGALKLWVVNFLTRPNIRSPFFEKGRFRVPNSKRVTFYHHIKTDFGCKSQKGWLLVTITAKRHAISPFFLLWKIVTKHRLIFGREQTPFWDGLKIFLNFSLTLNSKLIRILENIGFIQLAILHLKLLCNPTSGKVNENDTSNVLFQITSSLRNMMSSAKSKVRESVQLL